MRDYGIDKGLVKQFETSAKQYKGFFGFRKMFWTYLKKLGVAFYDPCCEDASGSDILPVGYDQSLGQLVYWNGTEYVAIDSFTTTTTTTAAPTTTTTTTAAPTTTTTTTAA